MLRVVSNITDKDLEELVRLIKPDYSLIEREALKLYCEIVQFLKMDDLLRPLWFSLAAFYQHSPQSSCVLISVGKAHNK